MPTDNLDPSAIQLISSHGSSATKVSQVIASQDKAVFAAIQQGINKANEEAGSRPQKVIHFICWNRSEYLCTCLNGQVQKFTILKTDFSLSGGELGKPATSKSIHMSILNFGTWKPITLLTFIMHLSYRPNTEAEKILCLEEVQFYHWQDVQGINFNHARAHFLFASYSCLYFSFHLPFCSVAILCYTSVIWTILWFNSEWL